MALPASDNFNNGGVTQNLSTYNPSWTDQLDNLRVVSNVAFAPSDLANGLAVWNADPFSPDHYSQCSAAPSNHAGVSVRASGTGGSTQAYVWDVFTGKLFRVSGSTFTQIALWAAISVTSTVRLMAVGSLLTGFINGSQAGSVSDATYTSGAPGIYAAGISGQLSTWIADNAPVGGPFISVLDGRLVR